MGAHIDDQKQVQVIDRDFMDLHTIYGVWKVMHK